MDIFERCHIINDYFNVNNEYEARNELIKLLDFMEHNGLSYTPLINNLIRKAGLFPYIDTNTSQWQEKYITEAFKVNAGDKTDIVLHREQSRLLQKLLEGSNIAISAPTSFGKSFIVDSFLSIKQPDNVVIIVPTIALADETRRRLQRKFGRNYKLITTTEQNLEEKNILIFPQERAINYLSKINDIDILIVDEFYKASKLFDKERAPALIRAILYFSNIAKQRYFLAPNITDLNKNPITKGMEFISLDFNTVFLEKHELYKEIGTDDEKKDNVLLKLLEQKTGKSLIYAGNYTNISKISNLLLLNREDVDNSLLDSFSQWLKTNYGPDWPLTKLVKKGIGIHNGQLHRSISQIQIKLFEENKGLNQLISTSSIIEGVNTSAENIFLWSNKNGNSTINDFTYKNIIGRGGRMFRHFIGNIYILANPPKEENTPLELDIPDELLGTIDPAQFNIDLTEEQMQKIESYDKELISVVGERNFEYFKYTDNFTSSDSNLLMNIAKDIVRKRTEWNGIKYLNSENPNDWDRILYNLINIRSGSWDTKHSIFKDFVKILSLNWTLTIPQLLSRMEYLDIDIDDFFKLERNVTFKLASLLKDVQIIYNKLTPNAPVDLSAAIARYSHAFLPTVVYQLEEYGIPRMLSKKIHNAGIIDFTSKELSIDRTIRILSHIGLKRITLAIGDLTDFDKYIIKYFLDGV